MDFVVFLAIGADFIYGVVELLITKLRKVY